MSLFCNIHTFVQWNYCITLLLNHTVFVLCWHCLHSILLPYFQRWRRRSPKTRWCWQEFNTDMKIWQLAPQCSVAYAQAHSSAVYFNKKVAWTFPIIIIIIKCIVSLPILFKNSIFAKKKLWKTSLKSTRLFSFFHVTQEWTTF